MTDQDSLALWFVTGSQHLYGAEALRQVAENAAAIAGSLSEAEQIPVKVVFKPVVTTPEEVHSLCLEANNAPACIGLITWMHTFSPAKMWIAGLKVLQKPFVHLHTQYNQDIPWSTIDMDFMNLNQSAHGGREFGFISARMRIDRTVIVGHWRNKSVLDQLGRWARVALAWNDSQGMKVARFGDNMREVAVTEGDKVSAQIQFGYSVNGYGVGDLVAYVNGHSDAEVDGLLAEYDDRYDVQADLGPNGPRRCELREAARIELGMRAFLEEGGFKAFTTTFEDLHGLAQLPGIAVQRLMADGYGFGAEGDWKTAALLRSMKVMADGLKGGTSFMEDYTYHFENQNEQVLGAHMLEICESIAAGKPRLEMHRWVLAGSPILQGWSSMFRQVRPLMSPSSTWETAFGCSSMRWRPLNLNNLCPTCPSPACYGNHYRASKSARRPGYWLGAPIIPGSVRRLTVHTWRSLRRWRVSSTCSSTAILGSLNSRISCAGTT